MVLITVTAAGALVILAIPAWTFWLHGRTPPPGHLVTQWPRAVRYTGSWGDDWLSCNLCHGRPCARCAVARARRY